MLNIKKKKQFCIQKHFTKQNKNEITFFLCAILQCMSGTRWYFQNSTKLKYKLGKLIAYIYCSIVLPCVCLLGISLLYFIFCWKIHDDIYCSYFLFYNSVRILRGLPDILILRRVVRELILELHRWVVILHNSLARR